MRKYKFSVLKPNKISVMFTWDDNFKCHYEMIAPLFEKYNFRCTFYINPGEKDFNTYSNGYNYIAKHGFEIGSHGYTHQHLSNLSDLEYLKQLSNSKNLIKHLYKQSPLTFAFPHHDFTNGMLMDAREIYLETRNTLSNTVRYSLKTLSSLAHINNAIEKAILEGYNIVFSGHGIKNSKYDNCGYEPISLELLEKLLCTLQVHKNLSVETFLQGTIKTFIKHNCKYDDDGFWPNDKWETYLKKYDISNERIISIL